ncbi:MAG: sulfatase [Planctomycetota bacterium]
MSTATQPNILTIILDDTDFSMMRWSGGERVLSPAIDGIAASGTVCSRFYVNAAVCTPGRYCYLTGHYAGRCPNPLLTAKSQPDEPHCIEWNTHLDPDRETALPRVLQQAGYVTGHVGKYHCGNGQQGDLEPVGPDDDPYDPSVQRRLRHNHDRYRAALQRAGYDFADAVTWGNADNRVITRLHEHNLEWICKGALDFLDEHGQGERPWHLNIATSTMHGPSHEAAIDADVQLTGAGVVPGLETVMPPRNSLRQRLRARGLPVNHRTVGMLWTDDLVAAVLARLRRIGRDQDTIVVFSTDHNCFDGKASCYEGGVHVPFAISWPGVIPAGATCEQLLMNVDLLPTLAGIAGATLPDQTCDGSDFLPVVTGREPVAGRWLYFDYGYQRAISDGRWKYIATRLPQRFIERMRSGATDVAINHVGKPGGNLVAKRYPHYWEPDQLFDLSLDPDERQNLIGAIGLDERTADMQRRLQTLCDGFDRPFDVGTVDPWLHSEDYRALCHAAEDRFDPRQWEWYAKCWY